MTAVQEALQQEAKLVSLARDIAQDIFPLDRILKNHDIPTQAFETILRHPRFQALLARQVEEWNSVGSTAERIRLKSLVVVEGSLEEFHARIHDGKETLSAKVEAMKVLRMLGGLAEKDAVIGTGMEQRFRLEIHIGETKPKVIDITPGPLLTSEVSE